MVEDPSMKKPSGRLDSVKKRLDSKYRDVKLKPRAAMHQNKHDAPDDWKHDHEPQKKVIPKVGASLFQKIFIGSAVFFAAALLFAIFSLLGSRGSISNSSIELSIFGKAFVDGGDELEFQVEVQNKNAAQLELADIVIEYSQSKTGDQTDIERLRRSLGTVKAHETVLEEFAITLFGEEGDEREISAKIEYRVEGSSAIFVKETSYLVTLRSTPIQIVIDAPEASIQNQIVPIDITVISNSTNVVQNMMLRVEYPPGFEFEESTPEPSLGNNIWVLGDIEPGGEREISFSGTLRGQDGEERIFRASVGTPDVQNEKKIGTTFNSISHLVGINQSFIGGEIQLQGENSEVVSVNSNNKVQGVVRWENTLPQQVRNVEITARFSGSAYDKTTVEASKGFFNSLQDEIVWSKNGVSEFGMLEPGESGSLSFSFIPKSLVGSDSSVITKPEVVIELAVKGTMADGALRTADNVDRKTAVINSDFRLSQKTLYHGGPFTNTGPIPPKQGQATTYTISWTVTNSSNSVSNAEVTTTLPSYVTWLGVKTPNTENVSYNSVTREVSWDIGSIGRGTGFSGGSKELSFKVSITPTLGQVNKVPKLTGSVVLSGEDTFTGSLLRNIKAEHTTQLLNDISSQGGSGLVAP